MAILKVASSSNPSATAGALANTIREEGKAELQVIGPKAVNQAIKAIAIARGYIAPSGLDLIAIPSFVDVNIDGEEKTAIRIEVRPRHPLPKFTQVPPSPTPTPTQEKAEAGVEAGTGAGTATATETETEAAGGEEPKAVEPKDELDI